MLHNWWGVPLEVTHPEANGICLPLLSGVSSDRPVSVLSMLNSKCLEAALVELSSACRWYETSIQGRGLGWKGRFGSRQHMGVISAVSLDEVGGVLREKESSEVE